MNSKIEIKNIIKNKNLEICFEPVVSVIKQSIIGFEVSSEGCIDGNNVISMETLIKYAEEENVVIDLDRLYREKAVENFTKIYEKNKEMLLFLNINASIISKFVGSGIIMDLVNEFNINPKNIVLEIVEDNVKDMESLKKFINDYRNKGFLVALSDIGYGFANLDKISYVEPDIIKISGAITENIEYDYYKQEIFKSLVNLCKSIGALVIGDGIENYQQTLCVIELGADMIQGKYFGNCNAIDSDFIGEARVKVQDVAKQYENYMIDKINLEKSKHKGYEAIMDNVLKELSNRIEEEFNDILQSVIGDNEAFECIYVLNNKGIQVSDTFTYCKNMLQQKALIFQPAEKGTNHSLKKYYYFLKNMGLNKYITEPYISLATGNLCTTISSVFESEDNKKYILCIDFNPNHINI
ncbi:EAL domain-containing protein [Clostridium ganghwense]|uniref:EAL domain-containing protein n=1 Tax=Clostridium ganghwense TaxID=312089 RepID=A0ABT4CTA8_9CLOT|nr:EAL domain-containing protein [Clostridium ganghwense]MCY6372308.1 EAL domain-containing protein [Clostridium ganghwense]